MNQKNKTILVVDDDQDMLNLLYKILKAAEFNVLLAKNPAEGRKFIETTAPHLILTDLYMQPEDGFEFIQYIRSRSQFNHIPILVTSGLNDFNSVKKAIAMGVADYVVKPLQGPILVKKLRKALSHKEFVLWRVPLDEKIILDIEIESEILSIGEVGMELRGPFRLGADESINIFFPEDLLKLNSLKYQTGQSVRPFLSKGKFVNVVTFTNITSEQLGSITKFFKERKKT